MPIPEIGVPLLDLKAQYRAIEPEVQDAIRRVVDEQQFILGAEVVALEEEISAYCGAGYGVGVSSGTDALLVSLMAADVGPGVEVITSTYTFFATAGSIHRAGATPVFVDIDMATFNIDLEQVEAAITRETRAVIPVHLFGQMVDMDGLTEIARRHGIVIIEDAAQAIGAERNGRRAGAEGSFGCFSFFPSKNLGAFGDGGMVVTSDGEMAERLRVLQNHGAQPKYHHKLVGGNFRLDALQAAVLRIKLKYLDSWTEARQRNAARYRELFDQARLVSDAPADGIVLPFEEPDARHIYNQFVIRTTERDSLSAHLRSQGIGCEIYYPEPLHVQECFGFLGYARSRLPVSIEAAATSLALPIYPELTDRQLERVVGAVAEWRSGGRG